MLGLCADLLDLTLACPSCEFLLDSAEHSGRDDCGVIVFHVVFRAFSVVDSDLLGDTVGDVGLVDDRIALISFVGEDGLYGGVCPFVFPAGGFDSFFFKQFDDISEAVATEELFVNKSDHHCFFGDDFGFAVLTSLVSEEILIVE